VCSATMSRVTLLVTARHIILQTLMLPKELASLAFTALTAQMPCTFDHAQQLFP